MTELLGQLGLDPESLGEVVARWHAKKEGTTAKKAPADASIDTMPLLDCIVVCRCSDAPVFDDEAHALCLVTSMNNVIDLVLLDLFKHEPYPQHLLATGLRRTASDQSHGGTIPTLPGIQVMFPNSLHGLLTTREWRRLHGHIGDFATFYLLRHTALFMKLDRGCLLQLTGPPLASAAPSQFRLTTPPGLCKVPSKARDASERRDKKLRAQRHVSPQSAPPRPARSALAHKKTSSSTATTYSARGISLSNRRRKDADAATFQGSLSKNVFTPSSSVKATSLIEIRRCYEQNMREDLLPHHVLIKATRCPRKGEGLQMLMSEIFMPNNCQPQLEPQPHPQSPQQPDEDRQRGNPSTRPSCLGKLPRTLRAHLSLFEQILDNVRRCKFRPILHSVCPFRETDLAQHHELSFGRNSHTPTEPETSTDANTNRSCSQHQQHLLHEPDAKTPPPTKLNLVDCCCENNNRDRDDDDDDRDDDQEEEEEGDEPRTFFVGKERQTSTPSSWNSAGLPPTKRAKGLRSFLKKKKAKAKREKDQNPASSPSSSVAETSSPQRLSPLCSDEATRSEETTVTATPQQVSQQMQSSVASVGEPVVTTDQMKSLLSAHTSHHKVGRFVMVVTRRLFPTSVFGSAHNWRVLEKKVYCCVCASRHAKFQMHFLLDGFKLSAIEWLQPKTAKESGKGVEGSRVRRGRREGGGGGKSLQAFQRKYFSMFMTWFFSSFVSTVILSFFYGTEGTADRHRVLYYRKALWRKITNAALRSRRVGEVYEMLKSAPCPASISLPSPEPAHQEEEPTTAIVAKAAREAALQQPPLGSAKLRLKPKTTGVRLIANMASRGKTNKPSVNQQLQVPLALLAFEQQRQPESTGTAIFGMDRFQEQYRRFAAFHADIYGRALEEQAASTVAGLLLNSQSMVQGMRTQAAPSRASSQSSVGQQDCDDSHMPLSGTLFSPHNSPASLSRQWSPYVFVSVDVKNCFDSIPQDRMFQILCELFLEDEYFVRKYSLLFGSKGRLQKRYVRKGGEACEKLSFFAKAKELAEKELTNAIITGESSTAYPSLESQLELISRHLFNNVVVLGGQRYRQQLGVPQGSSLSTMLCNLFYGHLEKKYLAPLLTREGTLLVRMVDDFLLITPDREIAAAFLSRMQKGFEDYHCQVNSAKTRTSEDLERYIRQIQQPHPAIREARKSASASTSTPTATPVLHHLCLEDAHGNNTQCQRRAAVFGCKACTHSSNRPNEENLPMFTTPQQPATQFTDTDASFECSSHVSREEALLEQPSSEQLPSSDRAYTTPFPGSYLEYEGFGPSHAGTGEGVTQSSKCTPPSVPLSGTTAPMASNHTLHAHSPLMPSSQPPSTSTTSSSSSLFASTSAHAHRRQQRNIHLKKTSKMPKLLKCGVLSDMAFSPLATQPLSAKSSVAGSKRWFPWAGLLFDQDTLEVRIDLSRYAHVQLIDCITIHQQVYSAVDLLRKGENFIATSAYPVLFDAALNGPNRILDNVYQMVYVGIAKFHCLVQSLQRNQKPTHNSAFFVRLFAHFASFGAATAFQRMRSTQTEIAGMRAVRRELIEALALSAVVDALARKPSLYSAVLRGLTKSHLRTAMCALMKTEELLAEAARTSEDTRAALDQLCW